ncbi:MAG TPA: Hsp20/alpha crystallin family protein [Planctomycetaceae bacterium]|nr:Hsp20/alpha crystallin family protein [Planctomycetaceae bacterium]
MNPQVVQEPPSPPKQESETPQGTERTKARKVYVPHVDIVENDARLLLIADMPGVDEHGVDVTVEKNVLTLKGTVGEETPAGYQLSYEEYGVGDYERSFTLSNEIDRDGIHATIKDGLLRLTLPKVKQAVTRKVAVVAG